MGKILEINKDMGAELGAKIRGLQGPILVLGADNFLGANLLRTLLKERQDVVGSSASPDPWRLEGLPRQSIAVTDLLVEYNLQKLFSDVKPRTVFDGGAYGACSFESEPSLAYSKHLGLTARILTLVQASGAAFVHAGSYLEYGPQAAGPREDAPRFPGDHAAAAQSAISDMVRFMGKGGDAACVHLRLYSVYGPYQDASELIPSFVDRGLDGAYPALGDPAEARDYVYVDDVVEAFIDAALNLKAELRGACFNIASGARTSVRELAALAREIFGLPQEARFEEGAPGSAQGGAGDASKAKALLPWSARTGIREGLLRTADWYKGLPDRDFYRKFSAQPDPDRAYSVSAVIACYKDGQAIPVMYRRLKAVFEKLNIGHEIIFVNDGSPDDSEEVIRGLSLGDRSVIGITHSRNFGSQAAFRSGMEIASKNAVVLLDGDLQDPPELIEQFVARWREGYEVVYGRRVKRQATFFMQVAAKAFYRLFDRFAYIKIPRDAGDFSLMQRRVVRDLLRFPERDLFVRGIRAFAGYRQTGVDYDRPERMFGVTTNNFLKNVGWAKKGILSFSNAPLEMVSYFGVVLFLVSVLLALTQVALKLMFPDIAPRGVTTTLIVTIFFGSLNLLAISIVGEYISKIQEEVKRRPHFIRNHIIRDGEVRAAGDDLSRQED
jgi:polyisoprenyl-phosphate glycosyltransferase